MCRLCRSFQKTFYRAVSNSPIRTFLDITFTTSALLKFMCPMNNYSEPIVVLASQQLYCMPFRLRRTLLHTTQCTLRRAASTSLLALFLYCPVAFLAFSTPWPIIAYNRNLSYTLMASLPIKHPYSNFFSNSVAIPNSTRCFILGIRISLYE